MNKKFVSNLGLLCLIAAPGAVLGQSEECKGDFCDPAKVIEAIEAMEG